MKHARETNGTKMAHKQKQFNRRLTRKTERRALKDFALSYFKPGYKNEAPQTRIRVTQKKLCSV